MQKCVKSLTLEVTPGFEPGNQGFADPCLTTWLCHQNYSYILLNAYIGYRIMSILSSIIF